MEIEPTVSVEDWMRDPEGSSKMLDSWTEDAMELLSSSGFWGSVGAAILIALKFVPQFAPAYSGIANIIGNVLAPKVHQDKVQQINQYAGHYIKTVRVIEDVGNQLPDSNGLKNIKSILKKVTNSEFHNAVASITADVHPDQPEVLIVHKTPSSKSQALSSVQ